MSRSTCIFDDGSIGDCTKQEGNYTPDDRKNLSVTIDDTLGYKFPVCTRDIGIYGFMLLGALAYPFIFKLDEKNILPPVLLVLAMVPIGLDGGSQFLSDVGINVLGQAYESTNMMRLITGGIAGVAVSFYAIPILNRMFG